MRQPEAVAPMGERRAVALAGDRHRPRRYGDRAGRVDAHARGDRLTRMRIIRPADLVRMPWKNGGGETTEIAVSPEAAGLDRFDWRVSMARVARNGPFSEFAERRSYPGDPGRSRSAADDRRPRADRADRPFGTAVVPGGSADHSHAGRRPGARSQRHDPSRASSSTPSTRLTIVGDRQLGIDGSTALLLCRSGSIGVEIGGAMAELQIRGNAARATSGGGPLEPARRAQSGGVRGSDPAHSALVRCRQPRLEPV